MSIILQCVVKNLRNEEVDMDVLAKRLDLILSEISDEPISL